MCQILVTQAQLSCPCQRSGNIMRCEGWKNIKERCPQLQNQRDVSDAVITTIYVDGGESINDLDLDNVGELLDWDLSKVTELRVSNTSVSSLQISSLTNLEDLDVRDNKLITMSPITRSRIRTLRMSGNPWPCVTEQREDVRSWTYSRFGATYNSGQRYLIDYFLRLDDASKMLWLLDLDSSVWRDLDTTYCDTVKTDSSKLATRFRHTHVALRDFLENTVKRVRAECPQMCECHLAESTRQTLNQV